jgi:hypothetical protein
MKVTSKISGLRILFFSGTLLFMIQGAMAAWLSIGSQTNGVVVLEQNEQTAGAPQALIVSSQAIAGSLAQVELGCDVENVKWGAIVPPEKVKEFEKGIILQGAEGERSFQVSEMMDLKAEAELENRCVLALDTELIPQMKIKPFGLEERLKARLKDQVLEMRIGSGSKPAGVILHTEGLPLPSGFPLKLKITYSSDVNLKLGMSDKKRVEREDPLMLGDLPRSNMQREIEFTLPDGVIRRELCTWTFSVGEGEGRAAIHSWKVVTALAPTRVTPRSTWVWRASDWQENPDLVFKRLKTIGATKAYITVPVDMSTGRVANPERLAPFIEKAALNKIQIWAVIGDPQMVVVTQEEALKRRVHAFQIYNQEAKVSSRLKGVQCDIEPYLIKGYWENAAAWNQRYLETIKHIKDAAQMPIEMVVPFWFARAKADASFLDQLAERVDSVVVMDYRSNPDRIQQYAEPFLLWGEQKNKPVTIALEVGKILDEKRHKYLPYSKGELWLVRLSETKSAVLLLNRKLTNPHGPSFTLAENYDFKGEVLSFHGHEERLLEVLPRLEAIFSNRKAFSGMALHEWYPEQR